MDVNGIEASSNADLWRCYRLAFEEFYKRAHVVQDLQAQSRPDRAALENALSELDKARFCITTAAIFSLWHFYFLMTLRAKISETPSLPEFTVEGGEGKPNEEGHKECCDPDRFGCAWRGAE